MVRFRRSDGIQNREIGCGTEVNDSCELASRIFVADPDDGSHGKSWVEAHDNPFIPSLGASGAISGVMGGYLVLHPHRRVRVIMLRMLTEVPGYVAVGLWFVLQLISAFGVIGLGMGYLTLRLRGVFFAIATLAMAVVLQTLVINWNFVGGSRGAYVIRPDKVELGSLSLSYVEYLCLVMLLLAVTALTVARLIERSRLGYGFATIRDDELAAESAGVPTLRPFRWPDSMGTELLPWEAGRAALDLLRFRDEQGLERPTVGEASWFWRLRQAAPTIPVEEGDLLAGWLAGADVLRALDRQAVSAIHDLEQRLTHERWGGTTVQKMIASRAAAREVLRRRFGEGVAGLIDDMATRSPTQPPLSPSAGAP